MPHAACRMPRARWGNALIAPATALASASGEHCSKRGSFSVATIADLGAAIIAAQTYTNTCTHTNTVKHTRQSACTYYAYVTWCTRCVHVTSLTVDCSVSAHTNCKKKRSKQELNGIKTQLKIKGIKRFIKTTTMSRHAMFSTRWQVDGCWRRVTVGPDSTQFVHLTAFIFIIFTFASRLQHAPQIITIIIRTHCPRRCLSALPRTTRRRRMQDPRALTLTVGCIVCFRFSLFAFHCNMRARTCNKLYNKLLLVNAGEGSSCILFGRKQFKPEVVP